MPVPIELAYSKTQVNKAGECLASDRALADFNELLEAYEIVQHYRSCHQYPLGKVTMGLKSMVGTVTQRKPIVAQRLKRFPQMIHKLRRHESMNLARMQDIGGCRALVDDHDEQARVFARLRKQWRVPDNRVKDYVTNPQSTGYRAIHLVVERDDRMIEVQIRTPGQQDWAMSVEQVAGRTGWGLKDGDGPADVLRYYGLVGEVLARAERGDEVPDDLNAEVVRLRDVTLDLMFKTEDDRTR